MKPPKISHSMRAAYKSCPRKVYYRWTGGIRRKWQENPARAVGRAFHLGLDLVRKGHSQHLALADATADLSATLQGMGLDKDAILLEVCRLDVYLTSYFRWYQADSNREWAGSEFKLEWRDEVGFVDYGYIENGEIWIVDDKTSGQRQAGIERALQIDDQLLTYVTMMEDLGHKVAGVVYRITFKTKKALKKGTKKKPPETIKEYRARLLAEDYAGGNAFEEHRIRFEPWQVEQYRHEKAMVNAECYRIMHNARAPHDVPRNSGSCLGKFGPCDYLDLCSTKASVIERGKAHLFECTGNLPMDGGELRKHLKLENPDGTAKTNSPSPTAGPAPEFHESDTRQTPEFPGATV